MYVFYMFYVQVVGFLIIRSKISCMECTVPK